MRQSFNAGGRSLLVSVIIPCYNGEQFLGEAIDSALRQTVREIEVIVVDDGSTSTGPRDLVAGYSDRIRYIRQDNKGISAARNTGIEAARGDLIAFLDDDDVWLPEKLEKQLEFLERVRFDGRDVGLVSTAFIYTDESLNEIGRFSLPYAGLVFDQLMFTDLVGLPSSVIVPHAVLEAVGGFNDDLRASEDYDLWLRIASRYEIFSLNEYLVKYRQRLSTVSRDPVRMVETNRRVTEMLIERERLDEPTARAVWTARRTSYAQRHRRHAYELLKTEKDVAGFRREITEALRYDASAVSAKDRLISAIPRTYQFLRSIGVRN